MKVRFQDDETISSDVLANTLRKKKKSKKSKAKRKTKDCGCDA